jgi:hypothetical protein
LVKRSSQQGNLIKSAWTFFGLLKDSSKPHQKLSAQQVTESSALGATIATLINQITDGAFATKA